MGPPPPPPPPPPPSPLQAGSLSYTHPQHTALLRGKPLPCSPSTSSNLQAGLQGPLSLIHTPPAHCTAQGKASALLPLFLQRPPGRLSLIPTPPAHCTAQGEGPSL